MGPQVALDYINAAKSTKYVLDNQFSGGENQGAFRVVNSDGTTAVLKFSTNPQWRSQIERAKAVTDKLRPLGYPVPSYLYVDATDTGTFWLENELPGMANGSPPPEQTTKLIDLIELQKDQVTSEVSGQDWSWYVTSTVFRGESGLVRALMQFSAETSALASEIEALAKGLDGKVLRNSDLVHGDLGISQVLFAGQDVAAVLDWDQAGYGDRALDLVSLWYSLINVPAARDTVYAQMLQISDLELIKIFAAYKMLAMIAWHINKVGGDVGGVVADSRTALRILTQAPA
jgi:thiamine kinase-like enzyme